MRYRDVSLRTRLIAQMIFGTTVFTIVLVVIGWLLMRYSINGPVYDEIKQVSRTAGRTRASELDSG